MKIETKFNVGEKVFFMRSNQVDFDQIRNITIFCYKAGENGNNVNQKNTISYKMDSSFEINENKCFKTKKELIDSL